LDAVNVSFCDCVQMYHLTVRTILAVVCMATVTAIMCHWDYCGVKYAKTCPTGINSCKTSIATDKGLYLLNSSKNRRHLKNHTIFVSIFVYCKFI